MRFFISICFLVFLCPPPKTAAQNDTRLQQYLSDANFFRLRDELDKKATVTSPAARLYYSAIVDNAFNRNTLAIQRADSFFALNAPGWSPQQILRLQEMLMDCYGKTGRYKDAADISAIVLGKYDEKDRAGLANSRKIWLALANVPAQTLDQRSPVSIPIIRNHINLLEIAVQFGKNSEEKFIFDTGANISTISESYADKMKVRRLNVSFDVSAGQGKKVRSGLAVADSLWIGSALLRNVIFIVMPDDKLNFPSMNVHLNGIIGFPVISAFKEIHISRGGRLTIPVNSDNAHRQNMSLNGLTPLVQVNADGDTLVFQFDTGAANTNLFSNYFDKNKADIKANSHANRRKLMSAGGTRTMKTRELYSLELKIGDDAVKLDNVAVYTRQVYRAGTGIAMGNIGQDVINRFSEMVLNFENMYVDFR